jgi:hypothetical protein
LIWIAMASLVGWVGFLVMAQFRAPTQLRSFIRWIAIAWLLIEAGVVLSMIASQRHWTLHHTALGVIGFLLPVLALACLAMGAVSWRRWAGRRRA